jgi:hypothetical protein
MKCNKLFKYIFINIHFAIIFIKKEIDMALLTLSNRVNHINLIKRLLFLQSNFTQQKNEEIPLRFLA